MNDLQLFASPFECDEFIQEHCCARCWGTLRKQTGGEAGQRTYQALCENCGEQTTGYVTRRYVERQSEKSRVELVQAKHALREALPWMKTKQLTEAELVKSLGF